LIVLELPEEGKEIRDRHHVLELFGPSAAPVGIKLVWMGGRHPIHLWRPSQRSPRISVFALGAPSGVTDGAYRPNLGPL